MRPHPRLRGPHAFLPTCIVVAAWWTGLCCVLIHATKETQRLIRSSCPHPTTGLSEILLSFVLPCLCLWVVVTTSVKEARVVAASFLSGSRGRATAEDKGVELVVWEELRGAPGVIVLWAQQAASQATR